MRIIFERRVQVQEFKNNRYQTPNIRRSFSLYNVNFCILIQFVSRNFKVRILSTFFIFFIFFKTFDIINRFVVSYPRYYLAFYSTVLFLRE